MSEENFKCLKNRLINESFVRILERKDQEALICKNGVACGVPVLSVPFIIRPSPPLIRAKP